MKKTRIRNFIILALFSVIVVLTTILIKRGHFYDLELYRSGDGWGYDILIKGKPYIHQPFIPAVEGEIPFRDRESARKTGRLVIGKIRKHEIPAVSKEEIERILSGK
jgi:hypothetical protein